MTSNTARKSTTSPAKGKGTAAKPSAPALDFTSLTASDADMPKGGRAGKVVDSPFVGWLRESKESGKAKSVTVPEANAKEVVYLIRAAANHLGIGSRIVQRDPVQGQVTILFAGKNRKQSRKGKEAAQTAQNA